MFDRSKFEQVRPCNSRDPVLRVIGYRIISTNPHRSFSWAEEIELRKKKKGIFQVKGRGIGGP